MEKPIWTTVNLPWNPSRPTLPPRPEAPFQRRDLCEGLTWEEYNTAHTKRQSAVWAREGIKPGHPGLSQDALDEIERNLAESCEVFQRIQATPEMQAWAAEVQRLKNEHETNQFANKIEVGMLIEFADGRRLLVGDMSSDGSLGGCCPTEVDSEAIVVRYTRVELPE